MTRPPQYTRSAAIAAIREHAQRHDGRPPTSKEWYFAEEGRPSTGQLVRLFGSFANAIVEAGFARPVRGAGAHRERLRIDLPFEDALRAAMSTPAPSGVVPPLPIAIETVRADSVRPVHLPMLWRDRIPSSTLSVIAGMPGLGKSTLVTAIAAELSQRQLTVVISNLEDDISSVTRPRLDVAGADLENIHLIPQNSAPMLPRDVEQLRDLILKTRASALFLDPVAAHFRPESRVHDRGTLRRLLQIARETRCAIIAVHHTVKTSIDGSLIAAIGGPSGGLGGTARAAYIYGYDPDDQDQRSLVYAKGNGFEAPPALIIGHETVEYTADDQIVEAGMLRFIAESNAHGRAVLRAGKHKKDRDADCCEWLTLFLSVADDCKRQVAEIRREGRTAGFGWQTLLRAHTTLKLDRIKIGFGGDGFWLWRLPDEHPLRQEVAA